MYGIVSEVHHSYCLNHHFGPYQNTLEILIIQPIGFGFGPTSYIAQVLAPVRRSCYTCDFSYCPVS